MKQVKAVLAALCVALAFGSSPLPAQTPADTAAMARAVARYIATDLMTDEFEGRTPVVFLGSVPGHATATRFDSLVARQAAALPAYRRLIRDPRRAVKIWTRGFSEWPEAPPPVRGFPAATVVVCQPVEGTRGRPGCRWSMAYLSVAVSGGTWEVIGRRVYHGTDPRRMPRSQTTRAQ